VPTLQTAALCKAPWITLPLSTLSQVKTRALNLTNCQVRRGGLLRVRFLESFGGPPQRLTCATSHWEILASCRPQVISRATSWVITEPQSHAVCQISSAHGTHQCSQLTLAGHCRRRKIRCLLAPDDPQGRCANCIRLKKECNFYPVEHNPDAPQLQSGATNDSTPGQPLTPAASSPRHPSSLSGEKMGEFRPPYHGASSTAPTPNYGFQSDSDMDSHHGTTSSRSK
jgi:hypothetical protein